MGNWQLEVARMALYIAFPIGIYHYVNQPEIIEEWSRRARTEMFPPLSDEEREDIMKKMEEVRRTASMKEVQEMERRYNESRK